MKKNKQLIEVNFKSAVIEDKVTSRDALIAKMVNKKNPPMIIENSVEQVINPYYVAVWHSEKGIDKDIVLPLIADKLGINWKEYWSDWCDFWFDSFTKIPHNILLDSKTYYKELAKL